MPRSTPRPPSARTAAARSVTEERRAVTDRSASYHDDEAGMAVRQGSTATPDRIVGTWLPVREN